MDTTERQTPAAGPAAATAPDALRQTVAHVAEQRRLVTHLSERLRQREEDFRAGNADLLAALATARQVLEASEDTLRQEAVVRYEVTGAKDVAPGVSIRLTTRVELDEDAALAFAKEKGIGLTFDRRALERIATADPAACGFATVVKVPAATIARDLDAVLAQEDA
jgi:hypothetical protein